MRRRIEAFLRREDGSGTIEFVILLPVILWPFLATVEIGFIQMRHAMLERATDMVVRELRLGNPELRDPEALKEAVCDRIAIMPDCRRDLTLAMQPIELSSFDPTAVSTRCVNRSEETAPAIDFRLGGSNQMMMLYFCVLHDPILPNVGLGEMLPRQPGGGFALTSTTFFVVEPHE